MSKTKDNIILLLLLVVFIFLFKGNALIRSSIFTSCNLWFSTLVPSMASMFLVVDLALNYGLVEKFYKMFNSNTTILIILSLLLGTPTSTKYIKDFYENGYITKSNAERILASFYSPNPLFIMSISPSIRSFLSIITFIYITDFIIFFILRKKNDNIVSTIKYERKPFSKCLADSSMDTFNILILVLGVIIFFGIINSILELFISKDNIIIYSLTEITNAVKIISDANKYRWLLFAISFAGLSIHAQIKSILDDTDIRYSYFLFPRLIVSFIALLIIILN